MELHFFFLGQARSVPAVGLRGHFRYVSLFSGTISIRMEGSKKKKKIFSLLDFGMEKKTPQMIPPDCVSVRSVLFSVGSIFAPDGSDCVILCPGLT